MRIEELTNEVDRKHATREESAPSIAVLRSQCSQVRVFHRYPHAQQGESDFDFYDTSRCSPVAQSVS